MFPTSPSTRPSFSWTPVPLYVSLFVADPFIFSSNLIAATAPPAYVDAMYSKIPGAQFDGQGGYIVPCDALVNVTMVFGENQYPMHPIDLTLPGTIDDAGNVLCQGAFSYSP